MVNTFNGWPVINYPRFTGTFMAPNGKTVYTANPAVATVFKYVAEQWHKRIEPIPAATVNKYPGERTGAIRIHCQRPYGTSVGTGSRSNHASGTAMDINGELHPYEATNPPHLRGAGYRDGFTDRQRNELIKIRNEIGKNARGMYILRLGIHFDVGKRDGMHVEIAPGITETDVQMAAARLKMETVVEELTGQVKDALDFLGYRTDEAGVREFQRDHGLTIDGIVGSNTTKRLEFEVSKAVDEIKAEIAKVSAKVDAQDKKLSALTKAVAEVDKWARKAVNAALWGGPARTVGNLVPRLNDVVKALKGDKNAETRLLKAEATAVTEAETAERENA